MYLVATIPIWVQLTFGEASACDCVDSVLRFNAVGATGESAGSLLADWQSLQPYAFADNLINHQQLWLTLSGATIAFSDAEQTAKTWLPSGLVLPYALALVSATGCAACACPDPRRGLDDVVMASTAIVTNAPGMPTTEPSPWNATLTFDHEVATADLTYSFSGSPEWTVSFEIPPRGY